MDKFPTDLLGFLVVDHSTDKCMTANLSQSVRLRHRWTNTISFNIHTYFSSSSCICTLSNIMITTVIQAYLVSHGDIHHTSLDHNCAIIHNSTKSMGRGRKRKEALAADKIRLVFTNWLTLYDSLYHEPLFLNNMGVVRRDNVSFITKHPSCIQ